jgi:dynein heavy chain
LTSGLKDEKERWSKEVEVLFKRKEILAGDSVIAAAMITYAGPFTSQFRNQLETGWVQKLDEIGIKHTPNINMRAFLGDSVKIQNWNIAGLPKDDSSTENGIIIDKARRWPLMIDPQTQANKFIKNLGKEHEEGIEILKLSDPNLLRTIEISIQHGKWVMVENIGTELDPALEPILLQQTFKAGGTLSITIGDRTIGYSEHFKFFMTTTNPNPHYPPETFVKVTIINFAITPSGLEEQMLAQIVALEDPQLEQKKTEIVKKNAQDRKELLALEDGILKSLSESQGDILMDETLINKLASSKKMSTEINQRVKDSKITEEQIDTKRESYRPAAFRASILFFCIMDLSNIDPMYQYSLQWFINLFAMGVENAPQSNEHSVRLNNLNNYFTYSLYENVCRSLFEKHKLLFSLLLAVKLLKGDNKLDEEEWFYLLAGFTGEATVPPNPTKWVPDNSWPGMYRQFHGMDFLPKLKGVRDHMLTKPDDFKMIYDEVEAHEQPLPEPWNSKLDELEKMIVLKAIRPDKLIPAVQNWVTLKIGKQFVEPPSFNLANCFKDATVTTPLIFVLSAGSDPVADFQRFAEEMGFLKKYEQISLGQGQGPKAEKMIREYSQRGGWVLLQNCHLAISWMSELEKICEGLDENIHKDFRLWLTSMPTPAFPISVLQNGVKMTLEPPTGLRANLQRTYNTMDDKELADCKKPDAYKKLLFGFALFHATVLERRKFGPIGWNIPYEFTNEDFAVCKKQLKIFLDEYDEIPFKVLNYIGAEINYGGRVTDDKDVRLIKTILETYIVSGALNDGYKYSESGLYYSAAPGDQADYINYIKGLPLNPAPEAFGLHDNAEISTAENTTRVILETILSTQPRSTAKSGKSAEEILIDAATNLEKRTPPVFDFDAIYKQYPTEYTESMNTVLVQEIIRYNRLLAIMPSSLANLKKAVKGEIVMSEELELMAKSLGENQVPEIWKARSFLSLKPLSSWIEDLNERITFLNGWIKNGTPNVFWISGLFFPQAFITGALQNYARKHVIAIDRLGLDFKIMDDKTHADIKEKPESGCYIYGMFIEGARWDPTHHALNNSKPKELYTELPLIWLVPVADRKQPETGIYNCPVYKVLSRAGTLSTTGHSTNFVMYIEIPSVDPESKWIKAGVAGFLSLRY